MFVGASIRLTRRESPMPDLIFPWFRLGRRLFLTNTGTAVFSATAVALLAGREALAADKKGSAGNDVGILNTALGAEQEAIAAYQVGAESGLLQKPVLDLAVMFQGQHKAHADLLASTVKKLGGTPVTAKKAADYHFPTEKRKTQGVGVLFAAGLEKGAVSAYLGAIPVFANRDLAKAAGSILGDEA